MTSCTTQTTTATAKLDSVSYRSILLVGVRRLGLQLRSVADPAPAPAVFKQGWAAVSARLGTAREAGIECQYLLRVTVHG